MLENKYIKYLFLIIILISLKSQYFEESSIFVKGTDDVLSSNGGSGKLMDFVQFYCVAKLRTCLLKLAVLFWAFLTFPCFDLQPTEKMLCNITVSYSFQIILLVFI